MTHKMWLRAAVALATAFATVTVWAGSPASASGQGNSGTVWVEPSTGQLFTGHTGDPSFACNDVDIWAANLSDTSGHFFVYSFQPSGAGESVYLTNAIPGTWTYSGSGAQTVAHVSVVSLLNQARANGDAPRNGQGYHFKVSFVENHKSATFWLYNCQQ